MNLKVKIAADGTKKVFHLVNVANVVNMPQPGVHIGGGLHALVHILGVIHMPGLAYEIGVSMYNRLGSDKTSPAPIFLRRSRINSI